MLSLYLKNSTNTALIQCWNGCLFQTLSRHHVKKLNINFMLLAVFMAGMISVMKKTQWREWVASQWAFPHLLFSHGCPIGSHSPSLSLRPKIKTQHNLHTTSISERVVFARGEGRLKICILWCMYHAFSTAGIPTNVCSGASRNIHRLYKHIQLVVMKALELDGNMVVCQG